MNSVNLRIRYRPVRIAWCIRDQNFDDLRRAIRLTHGFRGGMFNPIVPVDTVQASEMIRRFRADVLMNVSDDAEVTKVLKGTDFLPWPLDHDTLFTETFGRWSPSFLDISHTLNAIADERRISAVNDSRDGVSVEHEAEFALVQWEEDDPLKDVLLASFGAYADPNEIHRDYEAFIKERLVPFNYTARKDQPIPASLLTKATPSSISDQDLIWDRVPGGATIGFYAGSSNSFDDLVNFWNLRVCGVNVVFLDPDHSNRLVLLRDSHTEFISRIQSRVRHTDRTIAVWSRSQDLVAPLQFAHELVPYFTQVEGLNILQGAMRPPLHYISERRLLGVLSERFGKPTIAFQLPEKPFLIEDPVELHDQHFVVSVSRISNQADDPHTFWAPYIPDMNQWLGRAIRMRSNAFRVEEDGFGIICPITEEHLEIHAIPKLELAKCLFEFAGIKAHSSHPGRIATRLISQLGGVQGCRVLKIAGVRRLIKEHSALQEFGWDKAIQTIARGTADNPQPPFSEYEDLFIETRSMTSKLTPTNVFHYLLGKGVFRVGLTLSCPNCELSFWIQLDDVATQAECAYCGNRFDTTRQLGKDPWKYRRSGLFGVDNNQEGSIPVALTLQQLDTHLSHSPNGLLMTNLELEAGRASPKCETDVFVAIQGHGHVCVAVGECKDAKCTITVDDVRNLAAVADAFPDQLFASYIIFAKTGPFSQEEIDCCKQAQSPSGAPRVIMLSDRELEPYFAYTRASKQFEMDTTAISLDHLARSTVQLYFSPTPKESEA